MLDYKVADYILSKIAEKNASILGDGGYGTLSIPVCIGQTKLLFYVELTRTYQIRIMLRTLNLLNFIAVEDYNKLFDKYYPVLQNIYIKTVEKQHEASKIFIKAVNKEILNELARDEATYPDFLFKEAYLKAAVEKGSRYD